MEYNYRPNESSSLLPDDSLVSLRERMCYNALCAICCVLTIIVTCLLTGIVVYGGMKEDS